MATSRTTRVSQLLAKEKTVRLHRKRDTKQCSFKQAALWLKTSKNGQGRDLEVLLESQNHLWVNPHHRKTLNSTTNGVFLPFLLPWSSRWRFPGEIDNEILTNCCRYDCRAYYYYRNESEKHDGHQRTCEKGSMSDWSADNDVMRWLVRRDWCIASNVVTASQ